MLKIKKEVKLKQRVEKDKEIADMVQDIEEGFNESIIDEYHKLAGEIGYSTPKIVREKLLRFLKKNNLKVYNRLKVEAFLDKQYGEKDNGGDEKKPGWCWVGITDKQGKVVELRQLTVAQLAKKQKEVAKAKLEREAERKRSPSHHRHFGLPSLSSGFLSSRAISVWPSSGYSGDIDTTGRTYKNEIPMRILELISKVKQEIPELSCYVSDVALPKPDPFLYVTCEGMQGEVIGHWAEPNFID